MLTESRFTISYTGPAVESGAAGPERFQSALEGLADLIAHAATLLNGADCRTFVELTPAGPGSWDVYVQCIHERGQTSAHWITGCLGLTSWPEGQHGGMTVLDLWRLDAKARRCFGPGASLVH